uniref:Uncharacterized protein n=1 Tax=Oreochromis aureus TaxID=47969 RepID=A0AAZ1XS54_OREAU
LTLLYLLFVYLESPPPALSSPVPQQQAHLANGGRPYSQQMGDRKPIGACLDEQCCRHRREFYACRSE